MRNLEGRSQKNHRCFPTDRLKSTVCNENRINQLVYVLILRAICNITEKFNIQKRVELPNVYTRDYICKWYVCKENI
jgi:hypothetical protein